MQRALRVPEQEPARAVEHGDVPPAVFDELGAVQVARGFGHALAAHAQHIGDQFLPEFFGTAQFGAQVIQCFGQLTYFITLLKRERMLFSVSRYNNKAFYSK